MLAWTVIANIRPIERAGQKPNKVYKGTPIFRPNAKIYACEQVWGTCDAGEFIGMNRVSRKLSKAAVDYYAVHNCRTKPIYSESLLASLHWLEACTFKIRTEAEAFCDRLAARIRFEHDRRDSSSGKAN